MLQEYSEGDQYIKETKFGYETKYWRKEKNPILVEDRFKGSLLLRAIYRRTSNSIFR